MIRNEVIGYKANLLVFFYAVMFMLILKLIKRLIMNNRDLFIIRI